MTEVKAVQVTITGRVQGVSFRVWTERRASELGLSGWVRNRGDGAVEALFSGPADRVNAMVEACRTGPRLAAVKRIEAVAAEQPPTGGFTICH